MLVVHLVFLAPHPVEASILSRLTEFFGAKSAKVSKEVQVNSQNMPILQASMSPDPSFARGGGDITVVSESALLSDTGPVGTQADIDESGSGDQISIYVVRDGDSLGAIAKMYGVSVNTIIWANDLKGNSIAPGQKLVILPVSGIQYTIKKGDTVKALAKKYKVDVGEILVLNGLSENGELALGETLVIPDAELEAPKPVIRQTRAQRVSGPLYEGYYLRPLSLDDGHKTQGIHGWNGIDIGAPAGTAVMASAGGEVVIARGTGWNGGYGKYIIIKHDNGTQTVYGHLSAVIAEEGWRVSKGQIIGNVGSTGRSTGPHLHFEVRGAKNPF